MKGLLQDAKLQQWLLEACQKVLEDQQAVKEAVSRNKLQWPASQENPWQHLRLAAFSDNEAALPQEALQVAFRLFAFSFVLFPGNLRSDSLSSAHTGLRAYAIFAEATRICLAEEASHAGSNGRGKCCRRATPHSSTAVS